MRLPLSRLSARLVSIVTAVAVLCVASTVGWSTPAIAETVATCWSRRDNPHRSVHFSLTINAIASVEWCRGRPVPDLHLDVRIIRWTGDHWTSVSTKRKVLEPGKDLIRISRSTYRCNPGFYATESRVFGFGKHKPWKRGNIVFLDCGSRGGAGGGGGGGW